MAHHQWARRSCWLGVWNNRHTLLAGNLQCYHYLAVPKGDSNVPSRRTAKEPLREKVFSYYTKKERQLLERAAELESRSLSSFVALAAIERARRILGRS